MKNVFTTRCAFFLKPLALALCLILIATGDVGATTDVPAPPEIIKETITETAMKTVKERRNASSMASTAIGPHKHEAETLVALTALAIILARSPAQQINKPPQKHTIVPEK